MARDPQAPNTPQTAEPASKPGPPPGPKVRMLRQRGALKPGDVTTSYPYDSVLRLMHEGQCVPVDKDEMELYKQAYEKRVAAERRRVEEQQAREKLWREANDRAIQASRNRAILRPEVTR